VLNKYPNDVKLVIKNYPLTRSHKFAWKAAAAALAANEQGKFWVFHHKLFENFKVLNDTKIQDIAKELGLNLEKFNKDMTSGAIANKINRDIKDGKNIGVRGTPTIFINGKFLKKRSLSGFSELIDAELDTKE
jgi:protein-disulfide isomerase